MKVDTHALARIGASLTVRALFAEFPDLQAEINEATAAITRTPRRPARVKATPPTAPATARKPRQMSKAARKRISDAQKARWANHKATRLQEAAIAAKAAKARK